jgi:geranylgeranyl diphosphate synthase type II
MENLPMSDVKAYAQRVATDVDALLEKLLPPESAYPASIHKLMRYSTFAGGKRIRPALIMAAFEACGGKRGDKRPLMAGAAYEMLHTFSLIHDDLPCMDDDDFRRGKPTAHKAFSEALAVLGGDALCIFAFEVLARIGNIDIMRETAKALGTQGMIGGQVVDIESEGKKVTRKDVEYIHQSKTAAFIRQSVRTGALLAKAPARTLKRLTAYGEAVGLAFQVVDDILDEEGTTEQLGKDAHSDRERGKATFPAVVGMEESKRYASELVEKACAETAFLKGKGEILQSLARYIRTRIS